MNYFIRERQESEGLQHTAGIKARDDCETVFQALGFLPKPITGRETRNLKKAEKLAAYYQVYRQWREVLLSLQKNDKLYIQFPLIHHTLFLRQLFRRAQRKGASIILLVHDLEIIRCAQVSGAAAITKVRTYAEETSMLRSADHVIAHNRKMIEALAKYGVHESRMINLELFDYLVGREPDKDHHLTEPVIIAGALRPHKAGYVYSLPEETPYNLYGIGFEGEAKGNIHYFGSFPPDELPRIMEGSFGLVWDGNSVQTCAGVYGEYLRINNPHKTSLYLAAGIPVIIWSEAALAEFVLDNHCGITIDTLEELSARIKEIPQEEYERLKKNAAEVGKKLREGYYTKKAISQIP